jgi:hypothetical protein
MNIPAWRYAELFGTAIGVICAALIVMSFGGCGGLTLQPDFAGMSEKQIKALAADKNNGVWCGSLGAYGKGVYVSNDLATGAAAKNARTLMVDGSTCNVTITETPQAAKP